VVMIGGGLIGCETGYFLAETGHAVHVLEMRGALAIDANDSHRRALLPRMREAISWNCDVSVTEVTESGVKFKDAAGAVHFAEADTIIFATGMKPKREVVDSLRGTVPWFVATGDCVQARQVLQATYEGFCAAMDIL